MRTDADTKIDWLPVDICCDIPWRTIPRVGHLYMTLFEDYKPREQVALVRLRNIVPPTVLPQLRLIAVLREPIARDLSYFNHVVGEGNSTSAQLNLSPLCDASK